MNVWGIFRNLELYIPFDAKDEFSWVTSFSFSTLISFKKQEVYENKLNGQTRALLASVLQRSQQDAIVTVNQFKIAMVNRHLLQIQSEETTEDLLQPARMTIQYDN